MLLEGKVAVVSGGAKGIGEAICKDFSREGANVAIIDIDHEKAVSLAEELKQTGKHTKAFRCDVTNALDIKQAIDEILHIFSRIDILVNAAGGLPSSPPIEEMSEEEWDRVVALNMKSVFLMCKYVVPHMKKQHYGKIINFSSIGAVAPPAHAIHYNSAKAGVIGFTLDLAKALASYGITVNAVMPGPIKTPFYDNLMKGLTHEEREQRFRMMSQEVPMGRVGFPEEVANLVTFLASDKASYITGAVIPVGGGLPLTPLRKR